MSYFAVGTKVRLKLKVHGHKIPVGSEGIVANNEDRVYLVVFPSFKGPVKIACFDYELERVPRKED